MWEIHRGPVNFPHKWPVTRKMLPFDDVIMSPRRVVEISRVTPRIQISCNPGLHGVNPITFKNTLFTIHRRGRYKIKYIFIRCNICECPIIKQNSIVDPDMSYAAINIVSHNSILSGVLYVSLGTLISQVSPIRSNSHCWIDIKTLTMMT